MLQQTDSLHLCSSRQLTPVLQQTDSLHPCFSRQPTPVLQQTAYTRAPVDRQPTHVLQQTTYTSASVDRKPTPAHTLAALNEFSGFLKRTQEVGRAEQQCTQGMSGDGFVQNTSYACVKFSIKQIVFKLVYFNQIFILQLDLCQPARIQLQMGSRSHRHTLLHGAHQYIRARKGSPMATARTTRNLTAMVCCRNPERFSYQMERSCCWQLG